MQQVATAGGGGSAVAVLEAPVPPPLGRVSPLATIDEDDLPPEKRHCLQALREGKRCPPSSLIPAFLKDRTSTAQVVTALA